MKKGTVFLHKDFIFANGGIADKYFIILNNPDIDEHFLTCKTTSKPDSRPDKQGCHSENNLYVLLDNEDFFPKKTWVLFYIIYSFNQTNLNKLQLNGDVTKEAELKPQTIAAIENCVMKSEDLSLMHQKMLRKK